MTFEKEIKSDQSKKVILVTGGTGLVGRAIHEAIKLEQSNTLELNESWVFACSKDADLKYVQESIQF